jgi:integrator complex subunit 6
MIVVFVVDTSPSMAAPSSSNGADATARGISRLDVAKMSIEHLARSMDKRIVENNRSFLMASAHAASMTVGKQRQQQQPLDVGRLEEFDEFLLLSTSLQPDAAPPPASPADVTSLPSMHSTFAAIDSHASCGADGRLLVGSVEDDRVSPSTIHSGLQSPLGMMVPHYPDRTDFERELKRLRPSTIPSADTKSGNKFPEWAGGANGLNTALSHGLGLLSRYRLTRGRSVENFGMGRLPWMEHQMTKLFKSGAAGGDDGNPGSKFDSPLQPACLVLLTDGECLSLPPEEGGGNLTLRFGNMPLRDFYREREYGQEEVNHSSFLYVFGSVFHFVTTQTPFRLLLLH